MNFIHCCRYVKPTVMYSKNINMKKFSHKWWVEVAKKATYRANNYAWQTYYFEIAKYCLDRSDEAFWREAKL